MISNVAERFGACAGSPRPLAAILHTRRSEARRAGIASGYAGVRARLGRRRDRPDRRDHDPPARRRALPRRRRVRGHPPLSRPPVCAARPPRPARALGRGDRAARPAGRARARDRGPAGRARRRRRAAAADRHPRRPADRADRAARRLGRDGAPGYRHLCADRDPDRRQVPVLRRQHARDQDRQGWRRRRGPPRAPRRDRARGAHLDDLLGQRRRAAHTRAASRDPRLDHPPGGGGIARGGRGRVSARGRARRRRGLLGIDDAGDPAGLGDRLGAFRSRRAGRARRSEAFAGAVAAELGEAAAERR